MQIFHQETAEQNLARQSFEAFFPSVLIRYSRVHVIKEPLFRGYGFVRFDCEVDRWLSINSTRGVIRLLPRHHEVPDPMREGFVESMIAADPLPEDKLVAMFDDFYPGLVVTLRGRSVAAGRRGTVAEVRRRAVAVLFAGAVLPQWVSKADLVSSTRQGT